MSQASSIIRCCLFAASLTGAKATKNPMHSAQHRRVGAIWMVLALLLHSTLTAEEGQAKRLYTVGNSLTMTIEINRLIGVAKSRGHRLEWERIGIAGASLDYLWANRNEPFRKTLDQGNWDILSLQPFLRPLSSDLPQIETFMKTALEKNPKIVTFIYAQYIHDEGFDYQDIWLQENDDFIKTGKSEGLFWPNRCRQYYECLTRRVRETMPGHEVYMAPVGHAFALLDEKVKAGQVPGMHSIFQMWGDSTHANSFGGYLCAMVYHAMIFRESPVGLPIGEYQGKDGDWQISAEQARILQETAWEVVASHPLSGVSAPGEAPRIATPSLDRKAVLGEAYRKELTAVFGVQPYSWKLSGGGLPKGLALSADGKITGQPTEAGEFTFEVILADAKGASDKRSFAMVVEEDAKPRIISTKANLGSYRAGETIRVQFEAAGGNGKLKWAAKVPQGFENAIQFGLQMRADGLLSGSVGKPGTYAFKARVKDSDISSPEVVEQEYQITITEAGPDVLKVRTIKPGEVTTWPSLMKDDPKGYKETFFKQFDTYEWQPLDRKVGESISDNKAEFLVLAEGRGIHILVKVRDADNFVNPQDPSAGDSVELYLDILNNREKIYNADDRRLIFASDGTPAGSKDVRYGIVKKYADGQYAVHIHLDEFRLQRKTGPYVVMGFDVAVNDKDSKDGKVATMMWRGNALHEVDTSTFGTIIFMPEKE